MKKLILLVLLIGLFAFGCTSEFYKHDTVYATNSHIAFSWWGYQDVTAEEAQMSQEQGWWGKEIPYIPAE